MPERTSQEEEGLPRWQLEEALSGKCIASITDIRLGKRLSVRRCEPRDIRTLFGLVIRECDPLVRSAIADKLIEVIGEGKIGNEPIPEEFKQDIGDYIVDSIHSIRQDEKLRAILGLHDKGVPEMFYPHHRADLGCTLAEIVQMQRDDPIVIEHAKKALDKFRHAGPCKALSPEEVERLTEYIERKNNP